MIYINRRGEDEDTTMFMNTIQALVFQQHVNFQHLEMATLSI